MMMKPLKPCSKFYSVLNELYKNLTIDLSKVPSSNEIQQIVEEIADTTKMNYEHYRIDIGINNAFLLILFVKHSYILSFLLYWMALKIKASIPGINIISVKSLRPVLG